MRRTSKLCVLSGIVTALLSGCVGIGGETIRLSHDDLGTPTRQFSETLSMKSPAADLRTERDRIGRATVTVFAITSGSIRTKGPVEEEVANEVKLALEAGGYRVELVREEMPAQGSSPLVKVAIKEFWFTNYNWFWPLVPTGGDVEIAITVESAAGQQMFERSFKGSGNSLCLTGHCAFDTATKKAITDIGQQIRDAVKSEEFRRTIESIDSKPRAEAWPDRSGPAGKQQHTLTMAFSIESPLGVGSN